MVGVFLSQKSIITVVVGVVAVEVEDGGAAIGLDDVGVGDVLEDVPLVEQMFCFFGELGADCFDSYLLATVLHQIDL